MASQVEVDYATEVGKGGQFVIPIQDTVGFRMALACRAHRNGIAAQLAALGIYVGQELVLVQLWIEEGQTQSSLAERVGVDVSTMTKALQRLERNGFVERCADAEDERVSRVHLTDRGRALRHTLTEEWHRYEQRTLAGFTDGERTQLAGLLRRMAGNLS